MEGKGGKEEDVKKGRGWEGNLAPKAHGVEGSIGTALLLCKGRGHKAMTLSIGLAIGQA